MDGLVKTVDFQITVENGKAKVTRNLAMRNGDLISFTVSLPDPPNTTLVDLHRQSAQQVIAHLQAWLEPAQQQ